METTSQSEAPRPTYAERRKAALAAGAPPIPPKNHKKRTACTCGIKRLWTRCSAPSYVESRDGTVTRLKESDRFLPTCFRTEADAHAANERFRACHGYAEEVFWCEVHSCYHLRHRYSSEIELRKAETAPSLVENSTKVPEPVRTVSNPVNGSAQEAHAEPERSGGPEARPNRQETQEVPEPVKVSGKELPKSLPKPDPTALEEWLEECRTLAKSQKSMNWEIGDQINFGKRTFGDDAITAARKITRWTTSYVRRVAVISERFAAEKRLPGISWFVYQRLQPFPPEVTDKLLPLAAEKNYGARRLYALAIEMVGEDPADRTKNRVKKVAIPVVLYAKLSERANGGKVSKLAQEIIEEYLVGAPIERKESGPRTRAWREKVLVS